MTRCEGVSVRHGPCRREATGNGYCDRCNRSNLRAGRAIDAWARSPRASRAPSVAGWLDVAYRCALVLVLVALAWRVLPVADRNTARDVVSRAIDNAATWIGE